MCALERIAAVTHFALDDGISLTQWGGGLRISVTVNHLNYTPIWSLSADVLGFQKVEFCGFHGKLKPHLGPTLHRNAFPDFEEGNLMASLHSLSQMAMAVTLHFINSTGISNQVETVATQEWPSILKQSSCCGYTAAHMTHL